MEFFNQKLVGISSQIQTLNSLGNKISNIAKLDKKDFSLKILIPGNNKINIEFEYDSAFEKYLDEMANDLNKKEQDLNYIDKIITNMEMKEQFTLQAYHQRKDISSDYGERTIHFLKSIFIKVSI